MYCICVTKNIRPDQILFAMANVIDQGMYSLVCNILFDAAYTGGCGILWYEKLKFSRAN